MSTMTLHQAAEKLRLHAEFQASLGGAGELLGPLDILLLADAIDAHLAAREAEAVPKAWMRKSITWKGADGRREGERVVSEDKVYPDDIPLYAPVAKEAAAPAEQAVDLLDSPAKVGSVVFPEGAKWSSVVACAQRAYTYRDAFKLTPDQASAFREASTGFIKDVSAGVADFEAWYAKHAFDYAGNPLGSRDCTLQREAWNAALATHAHTGYSAVPDGSKATPREPTPEMFKACDTVIQGYGAKLVWQRMYDAAPEVPKS